MTVKPEIVEAVDAYLLARRPEPNQTRAVIEAYHAVMRERQDEIVTAMIEAFYSNKRGSPRFIAAFNAIFGDEQ